MPDDSNPTAQPVQADQAKPGWLDRCNKILAGINNQFHFFVSLPVITVIGSALTGHFQYLSAYQDKVNTIATQQIAAAETIFTEVSTTFSKAIILQQTLYFDYQDAIKFGTLKNETALETKNARAIYQEYYSLRTKLRESIDLLARKMEIDLDWPSDIERDAANVKTIGSDPMNRIALGAYNFDCDGAKYKPSFDPKNFTADVPPPESLLKENPEALPLGIDWRSAKHHLLTLYFCFNQTHGNIEAVREWASNSFISDAAQEKFSKYDIRSELDGIAIRLNAFMTLTMRDIEVIRVKFRPRGWYCHVPIVREIVDTSGKICMPIRTARN
jgi:hypothetical protein